MRVFQREELFMRDDISITAKIRARSLRQSLTDAERKLWYALRDRRMQAVKFRRRAPVGPYIADFLCVQHKLVVEADGSQHGESARDEARDAWLARNGYRILRFWNHEILKAREDVLATIAAECGLPW
jgi:very-short-patch-repair endonuclease